MSELIGKFSPTKPAAHMEISKFWEALVGGGIVLVGKIIFDWFKNGRQQDKQCSLHNQMVQDNHEIKKESEEIRRDNYQLRIDILNSLSKINTDVAVMKTDILYIKKELNGRDRK